jgi:hypothetical protein
MARFTLESPAMSTESRRGDSNPGPLHYEECSGAPALAHENGRTPANGRLPHSRQAAPNRAVPRGHLRQLFAGIAIVATVLLAAAFAPQAHADPVVGISDDAMFLRTSSDVGALLQVGQDHQAGEWRTIAYMGRDDARILAATQEAAARGMRVHVALTAPDFTAVTARDFATWAAGMSGALAATGAALTVSLLNEPDLTMPAAAECDTAAAVERTVTTAGYRQGTKTVAVPVTRRVRVVRRVHGKRRVTFKRVAVYRIVKRVVRRHGHRVVVRRRVRVTRLEQRATLVSTLDTSTTLTAGPQTTCAEVGRARAAARYLRAAIPAVRNAAPDARIDIGETSPNMGVTEFYAELARISIPTFDGVAHHPYAFIRDGAPATPPDGMLTAQQIPDLASMVHRLFGDVPIDLSEFGVNPFSVDDATSAQVWRATYAAACRIGARSLVAYQWWQTDGTPGWNTALLAADGSETASSQVVTGLHC